MIKILRGSQFTVLVKKWFLIGGYNLVKKMIMLIYTDRYKAEKYWKLSLLNKLQSVIIEDGKVFILTNQFI